MVKKGMNNIDINKPGPNTRKYLFGKVSYTLCETVLPCINMVLNPLINRGEYYRHFVSGVRHAIPMLPSVTF